MEYSAPQLKSKIKDKTDIRQMQFTLAFTPQFSVAVHFDIKKKLYSIDLHIYHIIFNPSNQYRDNYQEN